MEAVEEKRAFNELNVCEEDKKSFSTKVLPGLERNEPKTAFFSLTYLTPNYYTIYKLAKLNDFPENVNFVIAVWDINALTHAHMKITGVYGDEHARNRFMDEKIDELAKIICSQGISEKRFKIFKSSELWKRLISLDNAKHFINYMGIVGQVDTDIRNKKILHKKRITHALQSVSDLFFINLINRLLPEEKLPNIDLVLAFKDRLPIYQRTRNLMAEEGLAEANNPVFVVGETIPYFEYDHRAIGWNMTSNQISDLIMKYKPNDFEMKGIFEKLLKGYLESFTVISGKKDEEVCYSTFMAAFDRLTEQKKQAAFATNLEKFLRQRKALYNSKSFVEANTLRSVNTKKDAIKMGGILRRKALIDILLLANGERTITDIAKNLNKQVSNVSAYISLLREDGLIRIENGKIKRTVKGLAINFETGLS